jgi:hypothetical protein
MIVKEFIEILKKQNPNQKIAIPNDVFNTDDQRRERHEGYKLTDPETEVANWKDPQLVEKDGVLAII